ncbi:PGF-CTERM sorting domain-containing protein [Methanophagales archaeon]|nr:MAG: PGF-CTERM sorting domain-containing protein [Methanophagales archaeon]
MKTKGIVEGLVIATLFMAIFIPGGAVGADDVSIGILLSPPGFEAVFAFACLFAVAYLVRRRKRA